MQTVGLLLRGSFDEFIARYLPDGRAEWDGCRFEAFDEASPTDWLVVIHASALTETKTAVCDPGHVVYVSLEPHEDDRVGPGFMNQFPIVVSADPRLRHPGLVRPQTSAWWVGRRVHHHAGRHVSLPGAPMTYDDLAAAPVPRKMKRVSVVTSTLSNTSGHVLRNRFLEVLPRHRIGRFVDIYGGGRRPIADKWDAIGPYKYHLALENSALPNYWTEKLADAFLGYSLPIYWGCRNIEDFFPLEATVPIDLLDLGRAVETIEQVLDEDPYETRLDSILESRLRVLSDYNLPMWLSTFCQGSALTYESITLQPKALFNRTGVSSIPWRSRRAFNRIARSARQRLA